MKKVFYTILLTAVLTLVAIPAFCQVDTTGSGNDVAQSAASGLIDLLVALGVHIGGFKTVIIFIVGIVWRYIEKKKIKEAHAQELENVISTPGAMPEHIGKLQSIINRLRGIKEI